MAQWWEDPGSFPAKYDPSGLQNNPAGTIPFPYPVNAPSGLWDGGRGALTWSNDPVTGLLTARWQSPLFDLRPYLRAAMSGKTGGTPIWTPLGAGGKLWVQIENINKDLPAPATNNWLQNLQVISREYGHINSPREVVQITVDADITSEFNGGADAAVLTFLPTGEGYPIRWYRVEIEFTYLIARSAPPPFAVCAAYY